MSHHLKKIHIFALLEINHHNADIFLYKPWRLEGFFQFEITLNVSVSSLCFTRVMLSVYCHYNYFTHVVIDFRHQILMSKVGPSTEK